jgi:hypothetical protein
MVDGLMVGCGGRIRTCDLQVMSLTSYRAAPPRGEGSCWVVVVVREGAAGRDDPRSRCPGLGLRRLAGKLARHGPLGAGTFLPVDRIGVRSPVPVLRAACGAVAAGGVEVARAIRTGRLRASPRFHPRPIDVVVSHGPRARPGLEGGFPLRCLQRLSRPGLATRLRGWRHDRSTRGPSAPVLSYWGRPLASLGHPRQIGTELSHDVLNPAHVPL